MPDRPVYFLDTCIPIYAVGRPHAYREASARVLEAAARREVHTVTSVEVLQEIAYRFSSVGRRTEGLQLARDFADTVLEVLPVTLPDSLRALELLEAHPALRPRDALHVAVMEAAGVRRIITADRHFEQLPGLVRVDPTTLKFVP